MKRSLIWLATTVAGCVAVSFAHGANDLNAVANDSKTSDSNNSNVNDSLKIIGSGNNDRIDTVIVSAPLHKTAAETALPVTVLGGAELQQRAAGSIGATLDSSPGLANASFGPGVGQPVIRGQQGPRVQVLENGAASGDASGVSADHAVTVEPMLAETIEVLRGPSTLLYGGGAIGGVVNIIDNRIPKQMRDDVGGAIEYRHNSNDSADTSVLKLDGGAGSVAWHLDGVYRDWNDVEIPGSAFNREHIVDLSQNSAGNIDNTGGRNHSVAAGASWFFDGGYLGASINDMSNYYGIPAVAGGESGVHIDMRQKRYDVAGEWDNLSSAIDALRWRLTYTDYQHQELEDTGAVGTEFTNKTWQNRFELVHEPIFGWHGVVGLQLKRSDFAALGEEGFIPESIGKGSGLFVIEDYHYRDFVYELGLRYDNDTIDPDSAIVNEKRFNNISASAGGTWKFAPDWSLGLALSQSQRAPTVEELFSNGENAPADYVVHGATQSIEVGDSSLDKETSRNIDLTLSYKDERFDGYVTLFNNRFKDFIFLANSDTSGSLISGKEGAPILFYTQEDAQFRGAEFNLTTQLAQTAIGKFSIDIYGDSVRGQLDNSGAVPRLPPMRIGTRLKLDGAAFDAYAGVLHAAKQNCAGEFENDTDGYNRVDAGINYYVAALKARDTQLFVRGTNLTNQTIRASASFLRDYAPEAGRSIEAGVRFAF
jgi:iron complex outermembrane recepter protein